MLQKTGRNFPYILCVYLITLGVLTGCNDGGNNDASGGVGALRGVLLNSDGTPATEGKISLEGIGISNDTDSDGAYRLDGVPAGSYTLIAEAPNHQKLRMSGVSILAERIMEQEPLRLTAAQPDAPEPAKLIGWVYYAGESSHDGITVRLKDDPSIRSITDPDGGYYLDGLTPGDVEIIYMADGYESATKTIAVKQGRNRLEPDDGPILEPRFNPAIAQDRARLRAESALAQLPVDTLQGSEAIIGRLVVGAESRVIGEAVMEGAVVELTGTDVPTFAGVSPGGDFRFANVPPGEYGFKLESPYLALVNAPKVTVREAENSTVLMEAAIIELPEGLDLGMSSLAGAVVRNEVLEEGTGSIIGLLDLDDSTKFVTARVQLQGTSFATTPDALGEFRLGNLAPGTYSLVASANGHKPFTMAVQVGDGEEVDVERIVLVLDAEFPRVVSMTPRNGETGITIDEIIPIRIQFDQPMNLASMEQAFRIQPEVTYRLLTGGRSAGQSPSILNVELYGTRTPIPVKFKTKYTIYLSDAAQSATGLPLEAPFTASFTTAGPELVETFPADGDQTSIVSLVDPVVLYFNAPLDLSRDYTDQIRVRPSVRGAEPVIKVFNDSRSGWGAMEIYMNFDRGKKYTMRINSRVYTADRERFDNLPFTLKFEMPEYEVETSLDDYLDRAPPRGRGVAPNVGRRGRR